MSQVSVCLNEFLPMPDLRPKFSGTVTPVPSLHCIDAERPRRYDTPRRGDREAYGGLTSKGARINTAAVDFLGIAQPIDAIAYDSVPTSQGPVNVPREREHLQYIPSANTLHFLTHSQGSRLLAPPNRYFQ